jgi:hypothetical protein
MQAEVEERGLSWRQEILELATVAAPAWVAEWFGIETNEPVFVRRRRTWIEGSPTQLADSYYLLADVEGPASCRRRPVRAGVSPGSRSRDSSWSDSARSSWPECPLPRRLADCSWAGHAGRRAAPDLVHR